MLNIIDLFAGAGGLSLGATRAGFNVAAAVELDSNAICSHIVNFPNTRHIQKDIITLNGDELIQLSGIKNNDLLGVIGGPPCQGFSNIGHKKVDDIRNELFVKFFMLISELQPTFFIAENVPGIMNSKYEQIRSTAFKYVSNYNLLPPIRIIASEYGAPTSRTRYFFIGFKNDYRLKHISVADIEHMKVQGNQKTNVVQALEGLPEEIDANSSGIAKLSCDYINENIKHLQSDFFYHRVTGMRPKNIGNSDYIHQYINHHLVNGHIPTKHTDNVRKRYSNLAYSQQDKVSKSIRLNPDSYCPTLRAGTGPEKGSFQAVRPIHYKYARVITPREAARLQGFPDWYMLPNTIWHAFRQIGNSVSPIAAERILSAIYQKLT